MSYPQKVNDRHPIVQQCTLRWRSFYTQLDLTVTKYHLIPICPEVYGGLATPRQPSERCGKRVIAKDGIDHTDQFERGAHIALHLAQLFDCKLAVLKDKSPSCGVHRIYDGTFSGTIRCGVGVTAELLLNNGISVYDETQISVLLNE